MGGNLKYVVAPGTPDEKGFDMFTLAARCRESIYLDRYGVRLPYFVVKLNDYYLIDRKTDGYVEHSPLLAPAEEAYKKYNNLEALDKN